MGLIDGYDDLIRIGCKVGKVEGAKVGCMDGILLVTTMVGAGDGIFDGLFDGIMLW